MNIEQLPVEMLMKIFSHLSSYKEVVLVSKHFNAVACKFWSNCLTLDNSFFEKENCCQLLESIKHSNKRISKLVINFNNLTDTQVRSMIEIIEKFSSTINYFEIKRGTFDMSDFLEILALLPNVVRLVVYEFTLRTENQPKSQDHSIMPSSECKYLHQLKTLELLGEDYDKEFFVVLSSLSTVFLTELRLQSMRYADEMDVLMKRQKSIKNLTITRWYNRRWSDYTEYNEYEDYTDFFDNLELESLELTPIYINFATILSKQTKLKFLRLNYRADDDLVKVVVNQLTELETLYVELDLTVEKFDALRNIGNLKKLKDLTLKGLREENLAHFASLDNSRITSLDIFSAYLTNDIIHKLAKSAPNIKVLVLTSPTRTASRASLNIILRNFNFVKVLRVNVLRLLDNNTGTMLQGDCFNSNLIDLNIESSFSFGIPLLNELIANYPNVKTLSISSVTPFTTAQFQLILNGFQKMESMALRFGTSQLTTDDLQYLKHKKNLKFIMFGDLNSALRDELEKSDLFNVLFVVIYKEEKMGIQLMKVQ